jgi:hypothetical protein
MTRFDLSLLSQAHAVALTAMVAPETRAIPIPAARELHRRVSAARVPLVDECARFTAQLHLAHGDLTLVASAGRLLRDAVAQAMAYVPPDADRVDIHG